MYKKTKARPKKTKSFSFIRILILLVLTLSAIVVIILPSIDRDEMKSYLSTLGPAPKVDLGTYDVFTHHEKLQRITVQNTGYFSHSKDSPSGKIFKPQELEDLLDAINSMEEAVTLEEYLKKEALNPKCKDREKNNYAVTAITQVRGRSLKSFSISYAGCETLRAKNALKVFEEVKKLNRTQPKKDGDFWKNLRGKNWQDKILYLIVATVVVMVGTFVIAVDSLLES